MERLLTAIVKGVWYTLSRETAYNQLLNTTLGEGYRFETEHYTEHHDVAQAIAYHVMQCARAKM